MTIVFDFDYALFNTDRLLKAFRSVAERLGVPSDIFHGLYRFVLRTPPYDIGRHCRIMGDYAGCDSEALHRFLSLAAGQSHLFLYDDAVPALQELRRRGHALILLTFGDAAFQRLKVEASGIASLFDRVLYTETSEKEKSLEFLPEDEPFAFINDDPKENERVRRRYPKARVIQIVRHNAIYPPADGVEIVHSLTTLSNTLE